MNDAKYKKKVGKWLSIVIESILRKDQMSYQNFIDRIGIPARKLELYRAGKRAMPLEDAEKFFPFGVSMNFLCSGKGSVFRSNLDQVLAILSVFSNIRGRNHLPPPDNRQAAVFEASFFNTNYVAVLALWLSRRRQLKRT